MSNKKILVIGSANADLTIHTDRMPRLGETLMGNDFSVNCGGKGANQAVAVAKSGGEVSFFGAVGNDVNGKMLLDNLKKENVLFNGIVAKDSPTGTASITVIGGDNFIILDSGANNALSPEAVREKEEEIKNNDYIILQLEIPTESVSESAKIAKKYGKTVVLNPAPYCELSEDLYNLVDMIIPNEHEAKLMTGIEIQDDMTCKTAIEAIKEKGIKTVIITLGDKGCAYNIGDEIYFHPAIKVDAVDTTSAGDSFIGALITKLSKGEDLNNAISYATKVSSITVTRKGASSSIPYEWEIENL